MIEFTLEERILEFNTEISLAAGKKLKQKDYALLHFNFEDTQLTGELSTLPGYLPSGLKELKSLLKLVTPSHAPYDLTRPYFNLFHGPANSQLIFAFESALLPLLVKNHSLPHSTTPILTQTLLVSIVSEMVHAHPALKIKICRENLSKDIEYLKLARTCNPEARIRLDPNRELSEPEISKLRHIALELQIDGIEVSSEESLKLAASGLTLLLDDNPELCTTEQLKSFSALVIKPTRDGGLSSVFKWSAQKYQVTLSSTYESQLGLEAMILCAQIAHLKGAQGLGTSVFHTQETTK